MSKLNEKISTLRSKLQALEAEQKAQDRAARSAEKTKARKAEAQRKYELGGLLKLAGLYDYDKGALLGALLSVKSMLSNDNQFSEFKRRGDDLLHRREREKSVEEIQNAAPDESYLQ